MVSIIQTKKLTVKNPTLIEGFPGVGMIGTLATMYLVKELKMEQIGYLSSNKFPPFCVIHDGIPLHPARLYQSKKHNLIVFLSEFMVPLSTVYEVTDEILRWSRTKGVKTIFSIGGIELKGDEHTLFGIATTPALRLKLEKNGIILVNEGATTGVTGVLLSRAYSNGFPAVSIMASAHGLKIDLIGAANVLSKVSQMIGIEIDTKKLLKEGIEIERKMKEILKSARNAKRTYQKIEEGIPGMYR